MIQIQNKSIEIKLLGFSGGERHIQLSGLPEELNAPLDVKTDLLTSDAIIDLLLLDNALSNHYHKKILMNLEVPYFPYARQDRVCAEGQAYSLEVIANLLNSLDLNSLTVWDCHSPVTVGLTGAKNISPVDIIKTSKSLMANLRDEKSILVCPDKGAVERCTRLKEILGVKEIIYCGKIRAPETGKIIGTEVLADDLSGKTAIITDDICDGGKTFIKIAEELKRKNVDQVYLYVTHGIFSKGLEVFDGLIDKIFTTNSFPQKEDKKLTVINYKQNNLNKGEVR
ncbi:MAG: ribose-phosphate pyrophosphokinase [Planctomycetota bacterium]|nr:MAG: ribose-phosphate pyrophosphokinase [Planctomycetota bacterium]